MTLCFDQSIINWDELVELYRIAPLEEKNLEDLKLSFSNSMFKCFAFDNNKVVGVGRALADGRDCSYICDIAIHPEYQGIGLGKKIIQYLIDQSQGHKKIILYSNPGKEGFYSKLGFKKMNTAMAIFQNEDAMIKNRILSKT
ncbi:MAG: GNAT family N-acetyltransferase [bacterium]|nr:GNAT family N-acetyltransferase [bacterium]